MLRVFPQHALDKCLPVCEIQKKLFIMLYSAQYLIAYDEVCEIEYMTQ